MYRKAAAASATKYLFLMHYLCNTYFFLLFPLFPLCFSFPVISFPFQREQTHLIYSICRILIPWLKMEHWIKGMYLSLTACFIFSFIFLKLLSFHNYSVILLQETALLFQTLDGMPGRAQFYNTKTSLSCRMSWFTHLLGCFLSGNISNNPGRFLNVVFLSVPVLYFKRQCSHWIQASVYNQCIPGWQQTL